MHTSDHHHPYRQIELSREEEGATHHQIVWVPDDPRLKAGVRVVLAGGTVEWRIDRVFTTMRREVLDRQHDWRVGGIDTVHR